MRSPRLGTVAAIFGLAFFVKACDTGIEAEDRVRAEQTAHLCAIDHPGDSVARDRCYTARGLAPPGGHP